jgi:cytochrome c556
MSYRRIVVVAGIFLTVAGISTAQTARTARLMREKLQHSQRILAALTTSDYGLLQRETQALTAITKTPVWSELITPDLRPYTTDFTKALADLSAASERRDYDAAGASYGALVASCIDCHKHVAKSRVAGPR